MKLRASVAMATYNGEKYIREQIDSILANLQDNDELVISDDGSADKTLEIIADYAANDSRIRVIAGPCEGVIANFENAVRACRGKYIFLADQDDVWCGNKVETVMQYLTKGGHCVVVHDARVVNEDMTETIYESFFDYRGSRGGFINNFIKNRYMGCCMAFKSELVAKAFPIPRNIQMHDQWIGMIGDAYYGKSCFIHEQLLIYRRHEGTNSDFGHNGLYGIVRNRIVFLNEFRKHYIKNKKVGYEGKY